MEFEGEYYHGKRWNGKGYYKNGNIKYEIKDGKKIIIDKNYIYDDEDFIIDLLNRDKNGIEKGDNFTFKIEGEYSNGQRNEKGKEYDDKGNLIFEGEYLYDKKIKGKEYNKNGNLIFEGDYLYEKRYNGKEYDINNNKVYELINGTGKVKEYYKNGNLIFEGEYLKGKRNGKGKEYHLFEVD